MVMGPFHDNVKAAVSAAPGTGAITIGATATGCRAWSTVPAKQVIWYRAEDGSAWEIGIGFWNGATLTRNLLAASYSSTGALLNLSAATTVEVTIPAIEVSPAYGRGQTGEWSIGFASNSFQTPGMFPPAVTGSAGSASFSSTNYLTRQPRLQYTSDVVASAVCGLQANGYDFFYSTTAGEGGFDARWRFGTSQIPANSRLFVGFYTAGFSSAQPSSLGPVIGFGKDSTDATIQFLTNDSQGGAANKINTGISFSANGWYESRIIVPPGGGAAYGILIRLDTGEVWCGSSAAKLPPTGQGLGSYCIGGLGSTAGTALVLHVGVYKVRWNIG